MVTKTFYWLLLSFFLAHIVCFDFISAPLCASESSTSSGAQKSKPENKKKLKDKEEDDQDEEKDLEAQNSPKPKAKKKQAQTKNQNIDAQALSTFFQQIIQSYLANNQSQEPDEEAAIGDANRPQNTSSSSQSSTTASRQRMNPKAQNANQLDPALLAGALQQFISANLPNQHAEAPRTGNLGNPTYNKIKKVGKRAKQQHSQVQASQSTLLTKQRTANNRQLINAGLSLLTALVVLAQLIITNVTSSSTK